MAQLIPGWIRQLTTRKEGTRLSDLIGLRGKEGTGKFEVRGTKTGARRPCRRCGAPLWITPDHAADDCLGNTGKPCVVAHPTPGERQKQLNISIQSAAADIVASLIAADMILSQHAEAVEEVVSNKLRRAFEGATLAAEGWEQQVGKS